MTDIPDPTLPVLEPPPGGLAKLRARIADDDRARARRAWLAVPAFAAVAVAVLWLLWPAHPATSFEPPMAEAAAPRTLREPAIGDNFYWIAPTVRADPVAASPTYVDLAAITIAQP
jgi:hypothetical protein